MNKINVDATRTVICVSQQDLSKIEPEILAAKSKLMARSGPGNDFLGWIDLPSTIDKQELRRLKDDVARLSSISQVFVVVGIGGSYLGARAVIEAMQSELGLFDKVGAHPIVIYAGHTLSEDYYVNLLKVLDNKDYSVAVISKSGTTTEPAVAFRLLKSHLEHKYGREGARQRIVAVTDAEKGALHQLAVTEGYPMYVIPNDVGGRFSVLTPVGLLPIAMAGYDVDGLIAGACEMRETCFSGNALADSPSLMYAALRNVLYRKGKKVEMLVGFEPRLRYMSEWWKQLYGESEGKDCKGILPHSLTFTTDLHSMGQYVQDGERHIFETLLHVDKIGESVSLQPDKDNLDGLNYLVTKSLTEINHCAEEGTIMAHEDGGVPVIRVSMPTIDEGVLGQLLYFFEFACGVSGYTLGVNPFDQPGVEAYKRNMFRLLGKPGYAS